MRILITGVIALFYSLLPASSSAEEWKYITKESGGNIYYLDTDSIRVTPKGISYVGKMKFTKEDEKLKRMLDMKDAPMYIFFEDTINCKDATHKGTKTEYYSNSGTFLHMHRDLGSESYKINKGELLDNFVRALCKQ